MKADGKYYADKIWGTHDFTTNKGIKADASGYAASKRVTIKGKVKGLASGQDWDSAYEQVSGIIQFVLIKFPAHIDGKDAGKMEYDYACCAKQCGIVMSESRLFPSRRCKGYFGTRRFDREIENGMVKRVHMLTAAALLELDFEQPSLDYHQLMKLTKIITRDNKDDVENMFRRMCFNVFAHNRDDHSKNFTYLYEADEDKWHLSPAYDLTYSNTYYGEHTTSVDGNGRNPGRKELLAVGTGAGMKKTRCEEIIDEIEKKVKEMLEEYLLGK